MHVRYEVSTRRVKHLSVPSYTVPPTAGEADCEIADADLPALVTQLRLTADLTALEIDPALVPPLPARGRDFRRALAGLVDGATLDAKLDRADALWENPKVAALMQQLDNDVLSDVALALVRRRWASLMADGVPTASEIARIEAAAPSFGITLA